MTITLGEGNTPLLQAPRLSERLGVELWLKWEGANPTGSFKDRGMTVAVTKAVEAGATTVVCASTGNTEPGHVLVNSTNPHRIEGQKTAAFEILEQLGGMPDMLTLPYGGGGNTKAYARGFQEAAGALPRLHPVESAQRATTLASAIRITDPIHRAEVDEALAQSGGAVVTVDDAEIVRAWRGLGRDEGLFCEPASAAGLAGLERGSAKPGERVVCVITGHGLKDPDAVG